MDELVQFRRQWNAFFHGENRLKYLFKANEFFHNSEILNIGSCWEHFDYAVNREGVHIRNGTLGKYMLTLRYNNTVYNLDFLEFYDEKQKNKLSWKAFFNGFREDAFAVNGRKINTVLNLNEEELNDFMKAINFEFPIYEILKNTYEDELNEYISETKGNNDESYRTFYEKVV